MKLFLGVDGGQSATKALVGDETGRVIGRGRAGPCNHASAAEGRAKFMRALGECVQGALDSAGIARMVEEVRFEAACMGFSGGPADKDVLAREIVAAEKYSITHDAAIALTGATGGIGVVVIAGTGSMAFGRNADGRTARAGGWGYVFGDEGGAFHLVRQALRASLRFEEGWGSPTMLRGALLEASRTIAGNGAAESAEDFPADMNDLLHRFYGDEYSRDRIAGLAKVVDDTARAGDVVARDILQEAAQSLAMLAAAVRAQIFQENEIVRIAYTGGVFESAILLARMRSLLELNEANRVMAPEYSPVEGALIEAYRLAGMECEITGLRRGGEPGEKNSES